MYANIKNNQKHSIQGYKISFTANHEYHVINKTCTNNTILYKLLSKIIFEYNNL